MSHDIAQAALSPRERWRLLRIAEAATPEGPLLPPPSGDCVERAASLVAGHLPHAFEGWKLLARVLDDAALPVAGRPLSRLPLPRRIEVLEALAEGATTSWLVRAVTAPIELVRAEEPGVQRALGYGASHAPIARIERHAFDANRIDLASIDEDREIEVDVVVVGTGAGGAPLAAVLAERGHGVAMLEEGGDFTRRDFVGRAVERQALLYRDAGLTHTIGNTLIPLPLGKTVGGTTTINSGTCYRTPEDVQRRWVLEEGLSTLGPGSLDPYFEHVERELSVAPCPPSIVGKIGEVIARGADALGYAHGPLHRNAPGCDAQATCCFGCPTDAKRSTNVSYVPRALRAGAVLYHHAKVTRIVRERGRAAGVEAISVGGEGRPSRLVVRAKAVVLACGAIHTPLLLLENGLANSSGEVGRNLSIHPAGYAFARMPEPVRGWEGVPQSYAIEEFAALGIRFEGGYPPPPVAAAALGSVGRRWTEQLGALDHMAFFGFMLRDTGRGRVTRAGGGGARIRYDLSSEDVRRVVRAQAILARVFFAAGATEVLPGMTRFARLRGLDDVERLETRGIGTLRAHHLALTAYHPLGTCRMGASSTRHVVGPEHESFDVPGLFITDGSAVPGPLGVNPQITIMALSERAAGYVERCVVERERGHARRAERLTKRAIVFDETMRGRCVRAADERALAVTLTVTASAHTRLNDAWRARGVVLELEGTITVEDVAIERPCVGTLTMRPAEERGTLLYDVSFADATGARWSLRGEKHARLFLGLGMTRLHTELRREGELVAEGLLRFALRDLPSWLATFRVATADVLAEQVPASPGA